MQVGDLVLVYENRYRPRRMGVVTATTKKRQTYGRKRKRFVFVRFTNCGTGNWYHPDRVRHYEDR